MILVSGVISIFGSAPSEHAILVTPDSGDLIKIRTITEP